MKNYLRIVSLVILIIICGVLIIRETSYKNILVLVLFILSFILGRISIIKDKIEKEEIPRQSNLKNIPQEFRDEQQRFQELNKKGSLNE